MTSPESALLTSPADCRGLRLLEGGPSAALPAPLCVVSNRTGLGPGLSRSGPGFSARPPLSHGGPVPFGTSPLEGPWTLWRPPAPLPAPGKPSLALSLQRPRFWGISQNWNPLAVTSRGCSRHSAVPPRCRLCPTMGKAARVQPVSSLWPLRVSTCFQPLAAWGAELLGGVAPGELTEEPHRQLWAGARAWPHQHPDPLSGARGPCPEGGVPDAAWEGFLCHRSPGRCHAALPGS